MPVHLYRYSLREAKEHDEVQDWKQSHAENIRCRDAIDRMVPSTIGDIPSDRCATVGFQIDIPEERR